MGLNTYMKHFMSLSIRLSGPFKKHVFKIKIMMLLMLSVNCDGLYTIALRRPIISLSSNRSFLGTYVPTVFNSPTPPRISPRQLLTTCLHRKHPKSPSPSPTAVRHFHPYKTAHCSPSFTFPFLFFFSSVARMLSLHRHVLESGLVTNYINTGGSA